jgi:DNA-directed RNA polymerase specialized sigma24 family protein
MIHLQLLRTAKMPQLKDEYEMSQAEVGEKMFLNSKTIMAIEKRALDKIRKLLEERGIKAEDILEDK